MDHALPTSRPRLAALIGGLTLACDIASEFPAGKVLRTVILALRLGRAAGLGDDQLSTAFYASLLRYLGCTGFSHEEAHVYGAGDDLRLRNIMASADGASPFEVIRTLGTRVAPEGRVRDRVRAVARLLGDGQARAAHARAQCETSVGLARLVGMTAPVVTSLAHICERWDGRGEPGLVAEESIDIAMRLHHLADQAEIAWHREGPERACEVVRRAAGGWLDPNLCRVFLKEHQSILRGLDSPRLMQLFLEEEPAPHRLAGPGAEHAVARAFAHLTDLKSAFTVGHSIRVADLAKQAGEALGLTLAARTRLERAALLHDLGRLSVPNRIWDHPGPLSFADWERVRLHTYYTERVLITDGGWRDLAALAAGAHERPGGAGYPRALDDTSLGASERLLAAADVVAAMGEPRAHRPALTRTELERQLMEERRRGLLDARSVETLLAIVAGRPVRSAPQHGLSDRQLEVLRLLARGKTNKEIGALLGISARTVQIHVSMVYDKLGVYSRAGATLAAIERGLLEEG